MEGLTNGSKPNKEDDVSKSGKSQISIPPVEEETNSEDYHQMDNNGNLENGQFFTQLIQFLKMRLMFWNCFSIYEVYLELGMIHSR